MRQIWVALCGAMLLSWTAPGAARADPVQWSYSWSRSPDRIDGDGTTTSYIQLSDASKAVTAGTTAAPVVATNVFTYGNGPNGPPVIFTAQPYTNFMTLTIYDKDSGNSGGVSFDGEISGYMTAANAFMETFYTGTVTKSILIGKHLYTVQMDPCVPDSADASVSRNTALATVMVQTLPEPSAAVLAALGLPIIGLFWRRRRRGRPTDAE